jgi:hypothetical protein
MRFIITLLVAAACFGQGKQNVVQSGIVDAHGANWIPPTSTFASSPSSPATGSVYIFTDASAVGTCSGGGSALASCRWSGSAWAAVGGGGGGLSQASIFSGGTRLQRAVECASGTVYSASLTAAAANQEITIQTGISGNVRYASVLLSETTRFASAAGLTVSVGRPGSTTHAELTNGINFPLQASTDDFNYLSTHPIPPQITGTYDIVLNFAVTSGNVNAASAGVLTWEVCGYAARY